MHAFGKSPRSRLSIIIENRNRWRSVKKQLKTTTSLLYLKRFPHAHLVGQDPSLVRELLLVEHPSKPEGEEAGGAIKTLQRESRGWTFKARQKVNPRNIFEHATDERKSSLRSVNKPPGRHYLLQRGTSIKVSALGGSTHTFCCPFATKFMPCAIYQPIVTFHPYEKPPNTNLRTESTLL